MTEKVLQINREKYIFWMLTGILLLCVGFYIFCIQTTVRNVVSRQNLETEATQLTLSIGNKEFQYITMRNAITISTAHSLGFIDVPAKTFVSRESTARVAYLSNNL